MEWAIVFFIGGSLGFLMGFLVAAVMAAASRADDAIKRMEELGVE